MLHSREMPTQIAEYSLANQYHTFEGYQQSVPLTRSCFFTSHLCFIHVIMIEESFLFILQLMKNSDQLNINMY